MFLTAILALMALISAIAFVSAANLLATTSRVPLNQTAMEKLDSRLAEPSAALVPAPISGTKSVCPSICDYQTITSAIADIQAQGLGGALVLELASTYVSAAETFPITFSNLTGASAVNTVTVRPASGTTNLIITSANTTATVDLNNANFLTIDGRAGGLGTTKGLTLENTATAGTALRFINEASNNTVRYAVLKGVTTSANSGVIWFSTTTGLNGNDNNTIDNCDVGDGTTTPTHAIYSFGSTGTTAQNNSGNTVANSNIFNFSLAGVRLFGGSTDWNITGNSFYQTSPRAASTGSVFGILIETSSGNNFLVANNFIGGSAPNAAGAAWTTTGTTETNRFVGIHLNVGTSTPTSVQGNTIKNFLWTTASNSAVPPGGWTGINIEAGSVNIGTGTGNTIGSVTGTGSVSVTNSTSGGTNFGIAAGGPGSHFISNNTIGSITTNGTTAAISASLVGIQVTAGTNEISNNIIGSATTANSLNAATSSTSPIAQQVTGILSSSSGGATITGNTIANLNNNYDNTAAAGQIRGIVTSAGSNTIIGNTVRNLSTTSRNQNSTNHSVFGITQTSTTAGQTISQNVVHSLSNSATVSAVLVTGISYTGSASSGVNVIERNLVYGLFLRSTSSSSGLRGIQFTNGTFTAQNNMVRLGLDASGTPTAGASRVFGMLDTGASENRNFFHNSVYIGGTHTSGIAGSAPFVTINTNNARTIKNNIFVNVRNNNGGTGPQYAVVYGDVTFIPPTTGISSDNNIFYSSGSGVFLGLYNGQEQATIQAWRFASGQDAASLFVDPLFINPTGGTPDLHLQARNPAEGKGVLIPSVTNDFDGETRSGLTPTDIGADAGNFTFGLAPVITYSLLSNGSIANRTLSAFATITDEVGVASGANLPRFYFKKSTDADVFGGNTAADNGWKFVAASNASSPYTFTVDYSIINGGGVAAGDTIEYFVVAQDDANNFSSNPAGAKSAGDPPIQHVIAKPTTINSYSIVANTISGNKTICASGCDFSSLTGAGGVFAAINNSLLAGNLVLKISGDLTEDGTNGLNEIASNDVPSPAFTVTIQPADGSPKVISGNVPNGMIRLNGADRVIIDGRFNNAGRFLTFRNTNVSNPTITLLNDASNNTIRSSIIEGASSDLGNGVVFFSQGLTSGNDNNLVTDSQIRDRSDAPGVPANLISSWGSSAAITNSGNTISQNELINFESRGVLISPNNSGNESWTISGNTIYQTSPRTTVLFGINLTSGGTNLISQNTIRDFNSSSSLVRGIEVTQDGGSTLVSQNRIYALQSSPYEAEDIPGQVIAISSFLPGSGALTVANNQITLIPSVTNEQIIIGISDQGGGTFNAYFNSVLVGGIASGNHSTWACLRTNGSSSVHTSRNNICFNNRIGGSRSHFAAGNQTTAGSFSSDYNLFAGTGTPLANFMDFGTSSLGTPVSFATWKTNTGGDAHSQAGNPGGDFTTTMFVNPTEGDLHIVPSGNALVSNNGTPVAGIAIDYDNDPRSATAPDIGSDEFNVSNPATGAPTVISINDDEADNGVTVNTTISYTIRFSEDIEVATVSAADFDNAGTASITFGAIAEISPGVFFVQVTPTSDGTIILRIPAGAVISDLQGENLVTPVIDNDTVTAATAIALTVNSIGDAPDLKLDGTCDADAATPGSQCTLRAAIHEANNRPSDDIIDFSLQPNSTITLNHSLEVITNNLAINGPVNLLMVQRSTSAGIPNFRIFTINPATSVTVSNLTVANGHAPDVAAGIKGTDGGGILNAGSLSLTNVGILGNTSGSANGANSGNGGGIFNSGAVTLSNVTLDSNQTGPSNFPGGFGGGLYNVNGPVFITNSTINNNASNNRPGAGITNISGVVTVIDSAISNNRGFSGAGVFNDAGSVSLTNCTVSGNNPGGISNNRGLLTLTNCTITNNQSSSGGVGIINGSIGTANLKNTIVARNFIGGSAFDVVGIFVSQGHNLIGNNNNSTGFTPGTNNANGDLVGTSATPINPLLGPLQNNGGATQIHALLTGSPALDKGDNSFVTNPPFNGPPFNDQRGAGFARLVDGNGDGTATVDIGAFEAQVSVQDITDKATNEDTQLQFSFNVGGAATITNVTATSSNTALVPNNAANIAVTGSGSTRTLTINPAANQFGASTITVTVNGPDNQSLTDTFVLTVNPVADTPSVTDATTNANTQTTSGLVISRNPVDGSEVSHFKITGITGGSLFKNNGTTPINNGDFITFAEGNAGLKFTPGTTNGTFFVQASTSPSDAGVGGGIAAATITINPLGGVLRFSSDNYSVAEGAGSRTITVERSGDTSQAVNVDYTSSDHSNPADFLPCTSPGAGFASSRCDFTTAVGTLRFAAGETSKTFNVLISQDNYVEGPETLALTLSNPTGGAVFGVPQTATLTITDDATEPATNYVDISSEFVRSQYHDFLNREPDAPGLAFWTDNIEKCNDPARRPPGQTAVQCIDKQRESTAVAFFSSPEFQMTGGFVYRLYKGSLTGVPNYDGGSPGRFPTSLEFMRDVSQVSEGIVVSNQISGAVVEANRNRLAADFVLRPEFVAKYGGLNNTLYVQELFNTTGIAATPAEKQALVDGLTNATETRASVLRKVVDSTVVINEGNVQFTTTYGHAFYDQEFRRVFVYMEYVGYLRRNPDQAGFVFWLGKLNFYNGDPFQAELVRAFILSPEYRSRFGQP